MAEYLVMTLEDEDAHASQSPKEVAELIERGAALADELRRGGRLKDLGRLHPSKEGKRIRRVGDRLELRDGPFAEEGRALASYHWVEAAGADEATALAERLPGLPTDAIDVRPLMAGWVPVDKEARPGKLFACAVLGSTATERAWVEVMDRIDAETRGRLPESSFLGGLRLEPPSAGRRVVARSERRATLDGPFLESKEVIGGLVLMRMTSLDEVVRWASGTPFVVHGALEIRELWRT
jgi:hypothetical protein